MDKPPAYSHEPGFAPQYAPPPHPMMAPPHPMMASQPPAMSQQPPMMQAQQTPMIMPVQYGSQPLPLTCPNCNQRVVTELSYEVGGLTYLAAFGVALFFWCGCCLIPCCMDSCKDVHHRCPSCKIQLGIHKRL